MVQADLWTDCYEPGNQWLKLFFCCRNYYFKTLDEGNPAHSAYSTFQISNIAGPIWFSHTCIEGDVLGINNLEDRILALDLPLW